MHVLLLPSSYAPKVGGLETAVAHLGAELVRRGHRVTVVTNRYPRTLPVRESINGITVHRILMTNIYRGREPRSRLVKYLAGLAIVPAQVLRLVRLLRELDPTIVNAHYLGTPAIYARLAGLLRSGQRVALSVHGSDLTAPYPTGHARLSRYVGRGANAATACSNHQAVFLRELMGPGWAGPLVVTGNGVTPDVLQAGERFEHARPYLFSAARFIPKKGLDVLVRAMKQLHDGGVDVDLILAGAGPQDRALRDLVNQLGLEQRVRFWGVAGRAEIAALLQGCALFVQPSLLEGFGIAALEAMLCGRAVVASRCGGIPEVVRDGETGRLVPPGDVDALSAAIRSLLGDSAGRAALGARGREVALREFSWSVVADRYMTAYAMALES